MPTSVYIPDDLLALVDRKAKRLRISRNRLIVRALEREVDARGWSPQFFDMLREVDAAAKADFRESMRHVRTRRRSKRALEL